MPQGYLICYANNASTSFYAMRFNETDLYNVFNVSARKSLEKLGTCQDNSFCFFFKLFFLLMLLNVFFKLQKIWSNIIFIQYSSCWNIRINEIKKNKLEKGNATYHCSRFTMCVFILLFTFIFILESLVVKCHFIVAKMNQILKK